jgi:hypothetical protein
VVAVSAWVPVSASVPVSAGVLVSASASSPRTFRNASEGTSTGGTPNSVSSSGVRPGTRSRWSSRSMRVPTSGSILSRVGP